MRFSFGPCVTSVSRLQPEPETRNNEDNPYVMQLSSISYHFGTSMKSIKIERKYVTKLKAPGHIRLDLQKCASFASLLNVGQAACASI